MVKRVPSKARIWRESVQQTPSFDQPDEKIGYRDAKRKAILAGLRMLRAPAVACSWWGLLMAYFWVVRWGLVKIKTRWITNYTATMWHFQSNPDTCRSQMGIGNNIQGRQQNFYFQVRLALLVSSLLPLLGCFLTHSKWWIIPRQKI